MSSSSAFLFVGWVGNVCADDESFDGFSVPFTCLPDFAGEFFDFFDCVEDDGGGFDEPPFVGEGVDGGGGEGLEVFGGDVDTVEVQTGLFGWVGEDVFFERVVAELYKVGKRRNGERSEW